MANVNGGPNNDILYGTALADILNGYAGDDFLDGLAGPDQLIGGRGNDRYVVDNTGDRIIELTGEGQDSISATISYILAAGISVETISTRDWSTTSAINLTGNELANTIYGNAGANILDGGGGVDNLYGFGGDDRLIVDNAGDRIFELAGQGSDLVYAMVDYRLAAGVSVESLSTRDWSSLGAISLIGNELSNTLYGNAGANFLDGGGGSDTLHGFGGDDRYIVDSASDRVFESAGGGSDIVLASVDYILATGASVEALSTRDRNGSPALNLTGSELANTIVGNAGANVLNGAGGADILQGFGGNDRYVVDNSADRVIEAAGGGTDTVYAVNSYRLGAGWSVEILSTRDISGIAAIELYGNELANTLYGNAGQNFLDGGAGADIAYGFAGNDTYVVGSTSDRVFEAAGEGTDIVYASATYVLGAGSSVESLSARDWSAATAIELVGNEIANTLYGNAGVNFLDGGLGADALHGFGGDDRYVVNQSDDRVFESIGGGFDTISTEVSYRLDAAAEVERLMVRDVTGVGAIDLAGNGFANIIIGNAGTNRIDGGDGFDTVYGGAGADSFVLSAPTASNRLTVGDFDFSDTVVFATGAGGGYSGLASAPLAPWAFALDYGYGVEATPDLVLIYNTAKNQLWYDPDGSGAGAPIFVAQLDGSSIFHRDAFVFSAGDNSAPMLSGRASPVILQENATPGSVVFQAQAYDVDGDRVTYRLAGQDAGAFSIAQDGVIRMIGSPDYELQSTYAVTVEVRDSSAASQQQLIFTVADISEGSTPTIDEQEPNDGGGQLITDAMFGLAANPELPDDSLRSISVTGYLDGTGDVDRFFVNLRAGEGLVLDVDDTTGGLDSVISIAGPGILARNDDGPLDAGSAVGPQGEGTLDSALTFYAPESGTYSIILEDYGDSLGDAAGGYRLNISLAPILSAAEIFERDIQNLISDYRWNTNQLTFGFPTSASQYPPGTGEVMTAGEFAPFSPAQQAAVRAQMAEIDRVTNLSLSERSDAPGQANIRLGMSDQADPAYAYYPTGSPLAGTAWFNKTDFNYPDRGEYAWTGIFHEIGHTLGLKHAFEAPAISGQYDSLEFTIMTYRSWVGADLGGFTSYPGGYPQSLMMLDIAALQRMYGAAYTYNAGNTTYRWDTTTGEMFIDGVGQGAPLGGTPFQTIWDGGGIDTYDVSQVQYTLTEIDLRPGGWNIVGAGLPQLDYNQYARGNVANALMYDDDTRSLIENAIGGVGPNIIIGNQVANLMTGGGGGDTFQWFDVADVIGDIVTDFTSSYTLDFHEIDAIAGTGEDDAFAWQGLQSFSAAGQLRYEVHSDALRLFGETTGDNIADFSLTLIVQGSSPMEIFVNQLVV